MKKRVRVTLVAETTVEMVIEVEDGDDLTDLTALTAQEEEQACLLADRDGCPDWTVDDVEEVL